MSTGNYQALPKLSSQREGGFTLIELILTITILGVLSAFALPRFVDLGSSARHAAINGLLASVRSATAIAHAQAIVAPPVEVGGKKFIYLEGEAIEMLDLYPAATLEGIVKAANIVPDDRVFVNEGGGNVYFALRGHWSCEFNYTFREGWNSPSISVTGLEVDSCK